MQAPYSGCNHDMADFHVTPSIFHRWRLVAKHSFMNCAHLLLLMKVSASLEMSLSGERKKRLGREQKVCSELQRIVNKKYYTHTHTLKTRKKPGFMPTLSQFSARNLGIIFDSTLKIQRQAIYFSLKYVLCAADLKKVIIAFTSIHPSNLNHFLHLGLQRHFGVGSKCSCWAFNWHSDHLFHTFCHPSARFQRP